MVYCCNLATFGSPLTVCMPPAACQVDPEVSSARSISSTSFQPILVKWYSTLAPTTPPPITTAWAWLFMRSLIGYRQMDAGSSRCRPVAESLDQPRSEQGDGRIAERFG